ncbi:MAG TPA: cytochrome P450 [Solirubrobacterales bacterium]|nr:cytochrome P450 [Solirubrobacterales bacterium]
MGHRTVDPVESSRIPRAQGGRVPTVDVDLFADDVVEDSTAVFKEIRDTGPVVRVPRNRLWAMGRFEDVRDALRDDELFTSDHGVAANPVTNLLGRYSVLFSNGQKHAARRNVLMRSMGAKAIAPVADCLEAEADAIVAGLVGTGEFDAVRDFSHRLPLRVAADLTGLRVSDERQLHWATALFDQFGPLNRRWRRTFPTTLGASGYVLWLNRSRVVPGSWAASIFDAVARGEIGKVEARMMMIDLFAPSLDTTVIAITHMLWLLGRNPEAWRRIRRQPELISAAVVEAVRISSPVRIFTRRVSRDAELGGVRLHTGDRVAILFGAANMDERRFPDPACFDLDRPPGGNLGWGNGAHTCIGIHLAKLEMGALLRALVARVKTIETIEHPPRILSNSLQGFRALPVRLD